VPPHCTRLTMQFDFPDTAGTGFPQRAQIPNQTMLRLVALHRSPAKHVEVGRFRTDPQPNQVGRFRSFHLPPSLKLSRGPSFGVKQALQHTHFSAEQSLRGGWENHVGGSNGPLVH
jgi:hypothetical protein